MSTPLRLSRRAAEAPDAPISYLMEQGIANPGIISLAAGFVDQASLPVDELKDAIDALASDPKRCREALQYGTTSGLVPLRREIARRLAILDETPDRPVDISRLLLGTGSQQLLYLVAETLLDPGDIVLAGVPTYFVYMGALESFGARIVPVQTDEHGLDPDDLHRVLGELERSGELDRVKLIYDVTYFCNPTGITLAPERRRLIVEAARRWSHRHRILVIEDAAYRELRYRGHDAPSILAHDENGRHVIYAGTFSKPFAPGVRTGYVVLPEDLVEPITTQKGHHDFGSASLNQHLLWSILESGAFDRHLAALRKTYAQKLDLFLDILDEELPSGSGEVTWTRPEGGLYVWLRMPAAVSTSAGSAFFQECLDQGVLYVPGRFCYPERDDAAPTNELRLSFGYLSAERCEEGMRRICRVIQKHQGSIASKT